MKKFLSIILLLIFLMSLNVTAFAEEQVVSVSIPDLDYTMTIPADCTIEYKNTDFQSIGDLTVTSKNWNAFVSGRKAVYVVASSNGMLTNENEHMIPYEFGLYDGHDDELGDDMLHGTDFSCQSNFTSSFAIRVSDWSEAELSTTYTTTITYTASLMDTWW